MEYAPRPWVLDRSVVAYPNISDRGTYPRINLDPLKSSVASIRPRRELISPITSPIYSSGTVTSTLITGSRSTAPPLFMASLNAIEPAILNAISLESTSWYEPSYTTALIPSTGYPPSIPAFAASSIPAPTAGMYSLGIAPPTASEANSKVFSALASIGSKRTLQCPYCPHPPDCLAYLLSTSTVLVKVSL